MVIMRLKNNGFCKNRTNNFNNCERNHILQIRTRNNEEVHILHNSSDSRFLFCIKIFSRQNWRNRPMNTITFIMTLTLLATIFIFMTLYLDYENKRLKKELNMYKMKELKQNE